MLLLLLLSTNPYGMSYRDHNDIEAGKVVIGLGVYFDFIRLYVSFCFDIFFIVCHHHVYRNTVEYLLMYTYASVIKVSYILYLLYLISYKIVACMQAIRVFMVCLCSVQFSMVRAQARDARCIPNLWKTKLPWLEWPESIPRCIPQVNGPRGSPHP